jgi:hypothetical protein
MIIDHQVASQRSTPYVFELTWTASSPPASSTLAQGLLQRSFVPIGEFPCFAPLQVLCSDWEAWQRSNQVWCEVNGRWYGNKRVRGHSWSQRRGRHGYAPNTRLKTRLNGELTTDRTQHAHSWPVFVMSAPSTYLRIIGAAHTCISSHNSARASKCQHIRRSTNCENARSYPVRSFRTNITQMHSG